MNALRTLRYKMQGTYEFHLAADAADVQFAATAARLKYKQAAARRDKRQRRKVSS